MNNPRIHHDPTGRFSNRVDNYVKYRPSYPPAILRYLEIHYGLTPASTIADIGSGTGLLTKLFLDNGNRVYGVEPNEAMRLAAEQFLAGYPHFVSAAATAEATTLPDHTIDFVTAGQAFHWFDPQPTRNEFRRILRPQGHVVLIWNTRHPDSPFMQAYDALLERWAVQYLALRHQESLEEGLTSFFSGQWEKVLFDNSMVHDNEGLRGRTLSSSYAPLPGHPHHPPLMDGLNELFGQYQENGQVTLLFQTTLFIGPPP